MEDGVCNKHDKVMERLFDDISEIKITNTEIKACVGEVKAFKDMLHETIYGNGKEGLLSKVAGMVRQINLQWTLLVLLLGAIIGYFFKA